MTIITPESYHAQAALEEHNVTCIQQNDALRQDIRPLRIGILNIMPEAQTYEFNLLYPLGKSILQIEPVWIRLSTHSYRSSDQAHLNNLYVTFEEAVDKGLDGLIVTGAPVEELPFHDINYWKEISDILSFAREKITSTLGICWGGMALAKMLEIEKVIHEYKVFGVYYTRLLDKNHPVVGDLDDYFYCPQSRHAGYTDEVLESEAAKGNLNLLAHSPQTGYTIFETTDKRFLMHLGHPEYNSGRLVQETLRDRAKQRADVKDPVNFDIENPINTWRSHRNEFFGSWIKFIYDQLSLADEEEQRIEEEQRLQNEKKGKG